MDDTSGASMVDFEIEIGVDGSTSAVISAIITIRDPEKVSPIYDLYRRYRNQLATVDHACEFIFVLEGGDSSLVDELHRLKERADVPIKVLVLARHYGDATALSVGFDHAEGDFLLTLPAFPQVEFEAISTLVETLGECDMVVIRRRSRDDGWMVQSLDYVFHFILRAMLNVGIHDLACDVRILRKKVAETINIFGDQDRYLPVLASHCGFEIREIESNAAELGNHTRGLSIGRGISRVLDLLSIFFLTKFTRKPLRFFGFVGTVSFSAGFGISAYLTIQRLFMEVPLADKPMLLLGVLLIVLGVLFLAIGLVGEMIIFTNAGGDREYTIEKIIE